MKNVGIGLSAPVDTANATPPARRRMLFWAVCIPMRALIAIAVLYVGVRHPSLLPPVAAYTGVTAAMFAFHAVRAMTGQKTHGGFGGAVWWAHARYFHIAMWAACAGLAAMRVPWAGALLLFDVLGAVVGGTLHFRGLSA